MSVTLDVSTPVRSTDVRLLHPESISLMFVTRDVLSPVRSTDESPLQP